MTREVTNLKKQLADHGAQRSKKSSRKAQAAAAKKLKELLVRVLYVEMLGQDASFGYMAAVQMTPSENLIHKRVGYLVSGLCLDPGHDFRFMLVNQLQRDLKSSNHVATASALQAVCRLVTNDMIPPMLPLVVDLLKHEQANVRKKAAMTLHRFHQLNPASVAHLEDNFRRTLCDQDPSVMGAVLCLLYDQAVLDPPKYKDLVPSFVSILKQITEHRLPREFDYHRIPAPWIQMKLLKVLALLGTADQQASEGMYEVLHDVMKRADTGINVGYAIIYECVRTVTTIYPNTTLLDAAAAAIARFVTSDNHNLKYLGVMGLTSIVRDHPKYAAPHQLAVLDCLEDPDETLKRKTLGLLFRMTNPVNVEVIVAKLIEFLESATDTFLRTDLVERVLDLAERYAPSNMWYIRTLIKVFEVGGSLVKPGHVHSLLRLIAEGSGDDDEQADAKMRQDATAMLLSAIKRPVLPAVLLRTAAWALGEYGYCSQDGEAGLRNLCAILCEMADRQNIDTDSRAYAINACMKVCAQMGMVPQQVAALVDKYGSSLEVSLQQRCEEFRHLANNMAAMRAVLPVDASCEDIEVDTDLSFLNGFVQRARDAGAREYSPPDDDDDDDDADDSRFPSGIGSELRFDAYEKPVTPAISASSGVSAQLPLGGDATAENDGMAVAPADSIGTGLNMKGVRNVWGASGYSGGPKAAVTTDSNAPQAGAAADAGSGDGAPSVVAAGETTSTSAGVVGDGGGGGGGGAGEGGGQRREAAEAAEPTQEERKLTEREKMAAALFGGISPDVNAPLPSSQASSSATGVAKRLTAAEVPQPSASANNGVNAQTVPAAASPATDLLGLDFGATAAPAAAPAAASALGAAQGGGGMAPASGGGGLDDLLFLGGGSMARNGGSASERALQLSLPPHLASQFANGQRIGDPAKNIALGTSADGSLVVACHKLMLENELAIAIFYCTENHAISGLSTKIDGAPMCKLQLFTGDSSSLAASSTFTAVAVLAPVSLGIPRVTGSVSFNRGVVEFNIPMDMGDFLRPIQLATDAFGSKWPQHSCEQKISASPSNVRSPSDFMAAMQSHLHLHPVQSIEATQEAIAVGRLAGTSELTLVHGKISAAGVAVTIRSRDATFTQAVAMAAKTALARA